MQRFIACFFMTFVSNGLARFGYVVLIPLLILSGRLSQSQSYQLGIAILVGYIFGSLFISFLHRYVSLESIAKISLLLICCSFLACSVESLPFAWAWVWRFIAGGASASLMILAAPLSLPYTTEKHRGSIGGFVFSGIGIGAVLSGFILPSLVSSFENGIDIVWYLLSFVSFCAFVFSLFALPMLNPPKQKSDNAHSSLKIPLFLWLLIASYVLNAIGYLPHTLFWVDFLVRDLGISEILAGASWAFFGIGAALGSLGSGLLSDKIGLRNAHLLVLTCKALSCFIAVLGTNGFWLNVSVFIMGFTTTGNVTLTNALALKIIGKERFATASSALTFAFGVAQAVFSFIFVYSLDFLGYFWLFVLCGICLLLSAVVLLPIKDTNKI